MSDHLKRLLRIQKQIHKSIRAEVRDILGHTVPQLKPYYDQYKKEFLHKTVHSSKEDLLKSCLNSSIVLVGDFHTFRYSQKTFLKLVESTQVQLPPDRPFAIALEMIPSIYQYFLDAFLQDQISEQEFLEKMNYEKNWGFPWPHFKPILDYARQNLIPVIALNSLEPDLKKRDIHASNILIDYLNNNPQSLIFTLYGDLHLARHCLPKMLRKKTTGLTTIFQNSEHLYWKHYLALSKNETEIFKLSSQAFCIINAPPWLKLQSYLDWAEAAVESEDLENHIEEKAKDYLQQFLQVLKMDDSLCDEVSATYSISTLAANSYLNIKGKHPELTASERKAIQTLILSHRTALLPAQKTAYLRTNNINALSEAVIGLFWCDYTGNNFILSDFKEHFYASIVRHAVSYFGSKLLNHKRRCMSKNDLEGFVKKKPNRHSLPQERNHWKAAQLALKHLKMQETYLHSKKYRHFFPRKGINRFSIFFESSRLLGFILGENLFMGFLSADLELEWLQNTLFQKLGDSRKNRSLYLSLVEATSRYKQKSWSKQDLF